MTHVIKPGSNSIWLILEKIASDCAVFDISRSRGVGVLTSLSGAREKRREGS